MAKKIELIDTNILVRYLTGDNPAQMKEADRAFREAKRGLRVFVLKPLVVAETCYVLESNYKKSRNDVSEAFDRILTQRWLMIHEREELLFTMSKYLEGIHFVDAYLMACASVSHVGVFTFDKKLNKEILSQ
ncbi:MAG: PilT protein domain protein [Microgenomates group bacterium GW2011_GWA2_46_16]|nr:MAG: PilT protein domain protein [Microgenomates group bacterium GW2011_GWA2_46_16]